jgi:hypothetical protein
MIQVRHQHRQRRLGLEWQLTGQPTASRVPAVSVATTTPA